MQNPISFSPIQKEIQNIQNSQSESSHYFKGGALYVQDHKSIIGIKS